MKIATITCHNVYNYGASLQAYALQRYLSQEGHDVEIIDYKPYYRTADITGGIFPLNQDYIPIKITSGHNVSIFCSKTGKYTKRSAGNVNSTISGKNS